MASTRQIKSRIRSVGSTKQITKAMELVASSKLRRAQDAAVRTRQYADTAQELLSALSRLTDVSENRLFAHRTVRRRLVVLITSDRGLAGAYNSNALRAYSQLFADDQARGIEHHVICIGRKGFQFVSRVKGVTVEGIYSMPDHVSPADIRPVLSSAVDVYKSEVVDAVTIVTTRFINSFTQTAEVLPMLPAGFEYIEANSDVSSAVFEPSVTDVLEYAAVRLIEAHLYQAVLDASASEHAMRRVAMKNASDNATDIIDALTLEMNKVRQAGITQELSEISAGVEAMT